MPGRRPRVDRHGELDECLTKLVIERLSGPDAYPHLPGRQDEAAVVALRAEEAALRAELDGYVDDAAEGRIDRQFVAKVVAKLNTRIADAQRRIEQAITPPALTGLLPGDPDDPDDNVRKRWDRASISAKREVLRLLFASIVVSKGTGEVGKRVAVEWRQA